MEEKIIGDNKQNVKNENSKRNIFKNKKMLVLIFLIIAIISICLIMFFGLNKNNANDNQEKSNQELTNQELTNYECLSDSCSYDESLVSDLNLILVLENNKVFTYNMLTKEIINYELTGEIASVRYAYFHNRYDKQKVNKEDIYGLFVKFDDESENFYSFEYNKYILKDNVETLYAGYDGQNAGLKFGFLYTEDNGSANIIDMSTGKVLKTIDSKAEEYYFDIVYNGEYYWHRVVDRHATNNKFNFIDQNYNYINDNFIVNYSDTCSNYIISSSDGSLIITKTSSNESNYINEFNQFYVYNNTGKIINTSKVYKNVSLITASPNGYILVDDGSYYKLINMYEEDIITITKSTETTFISDYMDISIPKNSPQDLEIDIRDSAITAEELNNFDPDANYTEDSIEDNSTCKHYTYYYNHDKNTIERTGPTIGGCE